MRRKTTRRKSNISVAESEPSWGDIKSDHQFPILFNWYSRNKSPDDAKKYFVEYLKSIKESKDNIKIIAQSSERLHTTIGWLCRVKLLGGDVVPNTHDHRISEEKNRILKLESSKVKTSAKDRLKKARIGIQEHMQNQLSEYVGDLSLVIDDYIETKKSIKDGFLKEWLETNSVSAIQCKNIANYFEESILSELLEAKSKTCEQLVEAYSFLSSKELKNFISTIEKFVADAKERHASLNEANKKVRNVRPKRKKSPIEQIKKLQYLKEHDELTSIPATKIVEAKQLWVYNVKKSTLGVYICSNDHGFSVKGTTLLNYDLEKSVCKKVRVGVYSETIQGVLTKGKVALRKVLDSLTTKESKLNGRINSDTILLRVL